MGVSIQPMLAVAGGARAVEFYEQAFGVDVTYRVEAPDGAVVARLAIQGAEFWVTDGEPPSGGTSPVRIVLVVDDPDAWFARSVKAGASVQAAVEDAHGWRTGRVVDPFGHHWEIGKPLDGG